MSIPFDTIKQLYQDRGILTLENLGGEYNVLSWCPLIYSDSFPKWIEDKNAPDFSFKKYKFEPSISDIDAPYVIFKKKNDYFFYVIKNTDTLKFKIEN